MCEIWQLLLQEELRLPTWKTLPTFFSFVEQNRISLDEELKGEVKRAGCIFLLKTPCRPRQQAVRGNRTSSTWSHLFSGTVPTFQMVCWLHRDKGAKRWLQKTLLLPPLWASCRGKNSQLLVTLSHCTQILRFQEISGSKCSLSSLSGVPVGFQVFKCWYMISDYQWIGKEGREDPSSWSSQHPQHVPEDHQGHLTVK